MTGTAKLLSLGMLLITAIPAMSGDSTDALVVLTTVGYLTGAADGCGVASSESNALSSGMAIAINGGKYGAASQAHTLLNTARQRGISAAAAKSIDCAKIADALRKYYLELMK